MRALLVNPLFQDAYWSAKHSLPFVDRKCLLPPLGLITVAALLPPTWECRLVDQNVEELSDEQLRWADVVLLTGMLAQRPALQDVLSRCRELKAPTVVGGPHATTSPEDLELADHLVQGEAEHVVPALAGALESGSAGRVFCEEGKPDLAATPVPRYDLLQPRAYHELSLQFSRGCPFGCEFCDITERYGRRPRVKAPPRSSPNWRRFAPRASRATSSSWTTTSLATAWPSARCCRKSPAGVAPPARHSVSTPKPA